MKGKNLSRRDFLRVGVLSAAGAVFAGCAAPAQAPQPAAAPKATEAPAKATQAAPAPTAAPAAKAGGIVRYWFGWGANYGETVWNKLGPLPKLKEMMGPNQVEIKAALTSEVLATAVAAGTPPDACSNFAYLDYAVRGTLRYVDEMVAVSAFIKKENYLPGAWADSFINGKMYGVPANECFVRYGLYHNSEMAEKAGLDPNNPPQTISECFDWHRKLTKFDSAGNLVQLGLDPYDAMGGSLNAVSNGFYPPVGWGWKWYDENSGTFDLANDKMAEAFEMLGEFYKYVGPDKMAGFRAVQGQGTWGAAVRAGVQAMLIDGYWRAGNTYASTPEIAKKLRSSWVPVSDNRRGVKAQSTGTHLVTIFKDAQNPTGAFRLAEVLQTKEAMDIILEGTGWLPAHVPYLKATDPKRFPALEFFFKSVDEATEWHTAGRCPISAFAQNTFTELRENVFRGKMTGTQAAEEFQKRCTEEHKSVFIKS